MKNNQTGFTLIELVVTISAIAILASVATYGYQGHIRKAQLKEVANISSGLVPTVFQNLKKDSCLSTSNSIKGTYGTLSVSGTPITNKYNSLVLGDLVCPTGCTATYKFKDNGVSSELEGKTVQFDILNDGHLSFSANGATTLSDRDKKLLGFTTTNNSQCTQVVEQANVTRTTGTPDTSTVPRNHYLSSQFNGATDYKRPNIDNVTEYARYWLNEANYTEQEFIYTFPPAPENNKDADYLAKAVGYNGFTSNGFKFQLPAPYYNSIVINKISLFVGYDGSKAYVESDYEMDEPSVYTIQEMIDAKYNYIRFTMYNNNGQVFSVTYPIAGGEPEYRGSYKYRFDPTQKVTLELLAK